MKKLNSLELKDSQSVLIKRCKEIVDVCKKEVREMTDEEAEEFNKNKEEIKNLREQLDELNEKLASYDEELPEEGEEEVKEDVEKEQKSFNNKSNKNNMKETRFNLMKELRSALETGKKFNLNEVRAYTVNAEGEDVVQTDIFDIWEPLRAKNVLVEAGARFISGIKNNVQIPLMGAVSCGWKGETAAADDGSGVFTSKVLTPKRITAKYPISLELLAQDSIGIENAIRNDIIAAVNAKLEATVLGSAAGDTTKPAGLFYSQTPSEIEDFAGVAALEAAVETANVYGDCKYIVSPSAKADLRSMAKSATCTQMVMENGTIDGTPVLATSHIADKGIIYGDFSNLVIASWDNVQIDVVRDVDSLANGQVTIVVNAFVDAALCRADALAFGTTSKD